MPSITTMERSSYKSSSWRIPKVMWQQRKFKTVNKQYTFYIIQPIIFNDCSTNFFAHSLRNLNKMTRTKIIGLENYLNAQMILKGSHFKLYVNACVATNKFISRLVFICFALNSTSCVLFFILFFSFDSM